MGWKKKRPRNQLERYHADYVTEHRLQRLGHEEMTVRTEKRDTLRRSCGLRNSLKFQPPNLQNYLWLHLLFPLCPLLQSKKKSPFSLLQLIFLPVLWTPFYPLLSNLAQLIIFLLLDHNLFLLAHFHKLLNVLIHSPSQ